MRVVHDLGSLKWRLTGWTPHLWRLMQTAEISALPTAEIPAVDARVPGSVQKALRDANVLPDWNIPNNWLQCEWVENRHWIYEAAIPNEWLQPGKTHRLRCKGLDYSGWVYLNGAPIGSFEGTHIPHTFDLTANLAPKDNRLRIIFDLPPRWLGQFGYTSQVKEWKTRFNYTWDWQPRLVQIGIWEPVKLEVTDRQEIYKLRARTSANAGHTAGTLHVSGRVNADKGSRVRLELKDDQRTLFTAEIPAEEFNERGYSRTGLPVRLWWPNGHGEQPLYEVTCTLLSPGKAPVDQRTRRIGFRRIEWQQCAGAPEGADPWLCIVNGKPVFLQGVNCPPLLPNFADATERHYRRLLTTYRDLGVNTLRVNGVGYLEKELFYDLCDELGLMVWQDVPLSGSGVENVPPDDEVSIRGVAEILTSFIERRQHHACLLLWCGGNELHHKRDGYGVPLTTAHPLIAKLDQLVREQDPGRRFLPTTATGPRFNADAKDFGKGLHWNTHGPWKLAGTMKEWREYWEADDSLFRAESGAPGASPAHVIRRTSGAFDPMPVSETNPVWRRPLTWWVEAGAFQAEKGRPPATLEEYVDWSQARQAEALVIAVAACKKRFPRCGGILLWCGHDCHPCPANTSILDINGTPKPAARALEKVWKS